MNQKKIEFMYQAINDTQGTIRAIDIKLGFLFVVIFMPLSAVTSICCASEKLWNMSGLCDLLCCATGFLWIMSVIFLFLGLLPIQNIKSRFCGQSNFASDSYYDGGAPLVRIFESISIYIFRIRFSKTLDEYIDSLPNSESEIIATLAYEKMKISFVRNIKLSRAAACTYFTLAWLSLGSFLTIIYSFNIGVNK